MEEEQSQQIQPKLPLVTEVLGNITVERPKPTSVDNFAIKNPGGVDLYELERKRGTVNVPNINEVDVNLDRTVGRPQGPYQIALKAERLALIEDFKDLMPEIIKRAQSRNTMFNRSQFLESLKFIPNARFAYYNKLLREGTQRGSFTQDDIDYVDTVWMSQQTKNALKDYMRAFISGRSGFTIAPTQSRSGVRLEGAQGDKLALRLSNPGTVYFPTTMTDGLLYNNSVNEVNTTNTEKILMELDMQIRQIMDQMQLSQDFQNFYDSEIFSGNNELVKSLMYVRDKLLDKHLSYADLQKISDTFSNITSLKRSKYLLSLSNPFKHKTARIPTMISPPSATFSLRVIVPLTTNATGNVAFVVNPFALYTATSTWSTIGINNVAALDGSASNNNFIAINAGQALPADFYIRYRLVSSGLRTYCYPSSNNDNGILTVSVTFENTGANVVGQALAESAQFSAFSQIENGYYKMTTTIASREVQEHVYIPIDEGKWDYVTVGTPNTGFSWVGYITGAAASSTIARLELVMNFEALLDNTYTDYLPSESPMSDIDPKQISAVLSTVRKATGEPLTAKKIDEALKETNSSINPDSEIRLPPPKPYVDQMKQVLQSDSNVIKELVKDTVNKLPQSERSNWVVKVMDMVSPVASAIIQNVASRFMPIQIPKFMS